MNQFWVFLIPPTRPHLYYIDIPSDSYGFHYFIALGLICYSFLRGNLRPLLWMPLLSSNTVPVYFRTTNFLYTTLLLKPFYKFGFVVFSLSFSSKYSPISLLISSWITGHFEVFIWFLNIWKFKEYISFNSIVARYVL